MQEIGRRVYDFTILATYFVHNNLLHIMQNLLSHAAKRKY